MSMILATAWVRRGVAAQFPTKYEIDEEEIGRISKLAQLQLEDAQEDLENAKNGEAKSSDDGKDESEATGKAKKAQASIEYVDD